MTGFFQTGNAKLRRLIHTFLWIAGFLFSMEKMQAQHVVEYKIEAEDTSEISKLSLKENFNNLEEARQYIFSLPGILKEKGYITASVDSVFSDSASSRVLLFIGKQYRWHSINTDSIPPKILQETGWRPRRENGGDFYNIEKLKADVLRVLGNSGYPFAAVWVDSIIIQDNRISGKLMLDKGPVYHIDSIRNFGKAKLSSGYLQRYLEIMNESPYSREKLESVSDRLKELPFIQEVKTWDLTMHSSGSVLNLYLDPKKSSRFNVLVGFLPSNNQLVNNKMLITGEADINLRNALGNGETIGLTWQQIQVKSPRLNILFDQPYLFSSPYGLNFSFDLLKKDSSFINITTYVGAQYAFSYRKKGSVFLKSFSSNLLGLDTFAVKSQKKLPDEADIRSVSVGMSYSLNTTDYRFNPRKGYELNAAISTGTKTIRENNVIASLHDPSFDYARLYDTVKLKSYLLRIEINGAGYFPLSNVSTIKLGVTGGLHETEVMHRNELFQIGGYKLLRGFDEESIFASGYLVTTLEYRYLLGLNSYLYAFSDQGFIKNKLTGVNNNFIGAGLGLAFETRAGIFNISYAGGKRNDAPLNLRQSKIHLGYTNYF